MSGNPNTLYDVIAATWPAAQLHRAGPWIIRDGQGGGKRVSAATAEGPVQPADIQQAQRAMLDLGQRPLFLLRDGEADVDALLADVGYMTIDRTNLYQSPIADIATQQPPRTSMFCIWEPLQIQYDIWAAGGITAPRLAIMQRTNATKTSLFGRWNNRPAATGFVAIHAGIAMVHAVEVLAQQRGQKVASWLMRAAAFWAKEHGATRLAVLCTEANTAANGLYSSLGMTFSGQYHYRIQKGALDEH